MFKNDIVRTIGSVLTENGHKMTNLGRGCIYYMKRYSSDLAYYIRCSDNRNYQGDISIELFFTGVDVPCDTFLSFNVGLYVHIISIFDDVTDELLRNAGKKIVTIENNIGCLVPAILHELDSPYFMNTKIPNYKQECAIYHLLDNDETIHQEFDDLKKEVCKMIKQGREKKAYQLGEDFAVHLSELYFKNKGIDLEFKDIQEKFSQHLYAQCILDI